MTNRKILYGYQIQSGELAVVPTEAVVVSRVFNLYDSGLSYQKISDILNADKIAFSVDAPAWNKHKVKRLLENPRYIGDKGYPSIVDSNVFQRVQAQIQEKTADHVTQEKHPTDYLTKRLRCAGCGEHLTRFGRKGCRKDTLYLKCEGCGATVKIPVDTLLGEVLRQNEEQDGLQQKPYTLSEAVIHLENAINRGLEHPDKPEEVVALILQMVAAQYDCCPSAPILYEDNDRPVAADWKGLGKVVSHITISAENAVTVHFT